ncbi:MAG: Asp-tRNA(Asn)/Glu-tRNA(Gln) amidotransferase subunit GatA [Candidatus Omnitrophota bacterium]
MDDILSSIDGYKEWFTGRQVSVADAGKLLAGRISEIDSQIKAFAHIEPGIVAERASMLDTKKKRGRLWGVPIGLKDNICVKGELTTCSSRILEGFRPPYNAHVTERLLAEDALLIGKTNMDEFAFGSSCETSCYFPTGNPWDKTRAPGGSSGGSAAAVAGGEVVAALGSDTGGSIRQPAALCGVVGFKPTYGRVSRYGLIAFASSLDQIGPITRNVSDCAVILEIISGYDCRDSTSVDIEVPRYTECLSKSVKGTVIGIPGEYFQSGIDEGVRMRIEEAIKTLQGLGARTVDISLPHTKYAVSCYYIIAPAEASSNLARYDGVHYGYRERGADNIIDMYIATRNKGFGAEVKRRILLGTYALSKGYYEAYYLKAQKVRTRIADDFREAFKTCDCILTPTSPTTAFKIGERVDDPLKMYLSDVFTIPANLAGLPAVSIPCGMDSDGLPVGLQLMARHFGEEVLIRAAHAFESNTDHHKKLPSFLKAVSNE